jgi:hypothetical protein
MPTVRSLDFDTDCASAPPIRRDDIADARLVIGAQLPVYIYLFRNPPNVLNLAVSLPGDWLRASITGVSYDKDAHAGAHPVHSSPPTPMFVVDCVA